MQFTEISELLWKIQVVLCKLLRGRYMFNNNQPHETFVTPFNIGLSVLTQIKSNL